MSITREQARESIEIARRYLYELARERDEYAMECNALRQQFREAQTAVDNALLAEREAVSIQTPLEGPRSTQNYHIEGPELGSPLTIYQKMFADIVEVGRAAIRRCIEPSALTVQEKLSIAMLAGCELTLESPPIDSNYKCASVTLRTKNSVSIVHSVVDKKYYVFETARPETPYAYRTKREVPSA